MEKPAVCACAGVAMATTEVVIAKAAAKFLIIFPPFADARFRVLRQIKTSAAMESVTTLNSIV
jgi:hypothetical protein